MPQPPSDSQQDNGEQRRRDQTQLEGEKSVFHGIAQQKGEAKKQQQDPELRQRVTLHKPTNQ